MAGATAAVVGSRWSAGIQFAAPNDDNIDYFSFSDGAFGSRRSAIVSGADPLGIGGDGMAGVAILSERDPGAGTLLSLNSKVVNESAAEINAAGTWWGYEPNPGDPTDWTGKLVVAGNGEIHLLNLYDNDASMILCAHRMPKSDSYEDTVTDADQRIVGHTHSNYTQIAKDGFQDPLYLVTPDRTTDWVRGIASGGHLYAKTWDGTKGQDISGDSAELHEFPAGSRIAAGQFDTDGDLHLLVLDDQGHAWLGRLPSGATSLDEPTLVAGAPLGFDGGDLAVLDDISGTSTAFVLLTSASDTGGAGLKPGLVEVELPLPDFTADRFERRRERRIDVTRRAHEERAAQAQQRCVEQHSDESARRRPSSRLAAGGSNRSAL